MNFSSSEERQSKVMDQTKSKQHKERVMREKTNSAEGDELETRGCKLVCNNQNKTDRKWGTNLGRRGKKNKHGDDWGRYKRDGRRHCRE